MLEVYVDGSSLGNPGPAGAGLVIYKKSRVICQKSVYLGRTTNNVAEYMALILSLQEVLSMKAEEVNVYADSELIVQQVKGKYKVKNERLYTLNILAKHLLNLIGKCSLSHKNREENKQADLLAKQAAQKGR